MKALRRAVWLLALAACAAAEPVAEAPTAPAAPVAPAAVAIAIRTELQQLAPVAGSPLQLAQSINAQLAAHDASPAQALACRYLASALASPEALPAVRSFVLRSRAPEAARINADLSALAAPFRADAGMRQAFLSAAKFRTMDGEQLEGSLDQLFERSSARGGAGTSVLAAAPQRAGAAPADIPRLGPSIGDLAAQGAQAPMPTGSLHENDPAKIVVMHEPGLELSLANNHPESALFSGPVNWQGARIEHQNYRAALEAEGAQVFLVKDVLLDGTVDDKGNSVPGPKLEALRQLAGEFLKYDTSALDKEFKRLARYADGLPEGPYKQDVRQKLETMKVRMDAQKQEQYRQETLRNADPNTLVGIILEQPTIQLHLQSRKGKNDFFVDFEQEVKVKPVMNLFFSRDQQITTHKGVVITRMGVDQRKPENRIMKFVWEKLGIPIVAEVRDGTLEGGDYIPAGDMVFQGVGQRTTESAVKQLMREDAYGAKEIAVVKDLYDQKIERMHLDTVFNVLSDDKVLALDDLFTDPKKQRVVDLYRRTSKKGPLGYYEKVEAGTDLKAFLEHRGFRIATVSHQEQLRYALNFLNIGNSKVITPYGEEHYLEKLRSLGVDAEYVPMKCLTDGYGAAHCMTQVISREPRL